MLPSEPPTSPRRGATLAILAAYIGIAIALTWPLTPKMATGVPNDLGDPLLNVWILWWNAVKVPFTEAWWNAPAYFPTDGVLTFSEHLLGLSPLSTPIYWLTGNIQLGYNLWIFLSFPLSAFFGYLLCKDLTGRRDAAFIGGLIFGFTPYRIVQLPHIQVLQSYWMPITLLGLHRYLRDGRRRWLVLFGAGWLMQALCNGYYMAFLSVLVVCWLLWFVPWRQWRTWRDIGVTWALAALPVVPIILKFRAVHAFLGLKRSIDEIISYSADITSLFDHTNRLLVWRYLPAFHRPEGELFPGIAGVVLVITGLWLSRARGAAATAALSPWRRRLRIALGVITVVFAAGAVMAMVSPWEATVVGIKLSATHLHKPLTVAVVTSLALLLTSARVSRAVRGRTVLGFYVFAALLMWTFAFGPKPTFMGVQALYQGPYNWLVKLPGLDTLRVPARFHMAAVLCLSVAAALCFKRLAARIPTSRGRAILTGAAAVVALADTWIAPFPLEPAPKPWPIQFQEAKEPVVEVPLGNLGNDVETMYRSMWTGIPVVNGYSGFGPPWYGAVEVGLRLHDPALLQELTRLGVTQIVLNTAADQSEGWREYLEGRPDIAFVATDGTHRLYRLPPAPPVVERTFGAPVRVAAITTNVNANEIPAMTDGDLTTRWESGPQRGLEEVVLDLGTDTRVAAIELTLGPFAMDAPRDLVVDVSSDGTTWIEAFHGSGVSLAFRAAFHNPVRVPATFDIGDHTARYLRLRQLGHDATYYWSVAELRVLAPADR